MARLEIVPYHRYSLPIPSVTEYHFHFDDKSPGDDFVQVLPKDDNQEIRISPASVSFSNERVLAATVVKKDMPKSPLIICQLLSL